MGIFGKSPFEKALEEREILLSFIENELAKGTSSQEIYGAVNQKLGKPENKHIFEMEKKEAVDICSIPEKYNLFTRYIFLRALFQQASLLFNSLKTMEHTEYKFCYYANSKFIDILYILAFKNFENKEYKNAEGYFADALAVARHASGSPARAAEILGNLSRAIWMNGRKEEAVSKMREACATLEKILGSGQEDLHLPKEVIREDLADFKKILAAMGG